MKRVIYADNAATTQLDETAFEAMKPWLLYEFGNPSQPYALARKPKKAIAEARATIAECIHAEPEEIFFTSGGTESDNWAIKGSAFSDSDHQATITSAFEHHAILHSCAAIEKMGYPVAYLSPTSAGEVSPESLAEIITNRTRLVSVMLANNELGTIQPIKVLCEIAHAHGALFHTDAVQAIGHIPVDVSELGVDMLSSSAHKFNGPRGIGFLYIRKGTELPSLLNGGSQEKGRRAGTENVASIVGMSVALQKNVEDMSKNAAHICEVETRLLSILRAEKVPFIRNGASLETLPGVMSLSFPGQNGEAMLHRLDLKGITVSTGSACDSQNTEVSHVLKAISVESNYANGTIRISLGKNNTLEDAECIAKEIITIVK